MPSKLDELSMAHGKKEGCKIEDTIACYEAIQFGYFEDEKMSNCFKTKQEQSGPQITVVENLASNLSNQST